MQFNLNSKNRNVVPFYYRKQGIQQKQIILKSISSSQHTDEQKSDCGSTKSKKHFSYQRYHNKIKSCQNTTTTTTDSTIIYPSNNEIEYSIGDIVYSLSPMKNYFVKSKTHSSLIGGRRLSRRAKTGDA
jgi:hypothetical protein